MTRTDKYMQSIRSDVHLENYQIICKFHEGKGKYIRSLPIGVLEGKNNIMILDS